MADKPTYAELEKRLQEAEEIIDTLRNHQVDAVIGTDQIAMMRLKQVEDELQEQRQISSNRLNEIESIYQNVPVGLAILDLELRFVRVNAHLATINGIPADKHLGRKISDLLPDLSGGTQENLRRVIETGKPEMEVKLSGETPAQPGVIRHWVQHWLPLYNKQEEIIGINMVVEEVTEQKKFEDKLRKLNATLEERVSERTAIAEQRADKLREMALKMTHVEEQERQRLARMLHDGLQQLLIGAKFNTSLIIRQLSGQEKIRERMDDLDQILDKSIKASRSLSYELSPPILHDHGLLAGLEWLSDMQHMKGLNITIQADDELPELSQNLKVFLFHSVKELLINIIKHAGVEQAEVRLSGDDQQLDIQVIDRGKGFDPVNITERNPESQGLRNIQEKLELMNGGMKIQSKSGEGSRFTLTVPVGRSTDSSTPAEALGEYSGISRSKSGKYTGTVPGASGETGILVVDDHQVMRNGLVRLLAEEPDFTIAGEASNGIEAIEFVRNFQPDVIIMDITMPEMDGVEATRRIHEMHPEIGIIGLSMHEEGEYSTLMKEAGATNLLNKGGPADKLISAIRSILT